MFFLLLHSSFRTVLSPLLFLVIGAFCVDSHASGINDKSYQTQLLSPTRLNQLRPPRRISVDRGNPRHSPLDPIIEESSPPTASAESNTELTTPFSALGRSHTAHPTSVNNTDSNEEDLELSQTSRIERSRSATHHAHPKYKVGSRLDWPQNKVVMIVEDGAVNYKSFVNNLSRLGVTSGRLGKKELEQINRDGFAILPGVIIATTAEAALDAYDTYYAQTGSVPVEIFMDLNFPSTSAAHDSDGPTGMMLTQVLLSAPRFYPGPIVRQSADTSPEVVEKFKQYGAIESISKTYNILEIGNRLIRHTVPEFNTPEFVSALQQTQSVNDQISSPNEFCPPK